MLEKKKAIFGTKSETWWEHSDTMVEGNGITVKLHTGKGECMKCAEEASSAPGCLSGMFVIYEWRTMSLPTHSQV